MKYVLGVMGVILVAVLAILLITKGDGGGGSKKPRFLDVSKEANADTTAVFTTQGMLVGEDQRRGIRISVSQEERRIEILTGYDEAVDKAQTYANTPAAYEAFLTALHYQQFERQRESTIDPIGACPSGKRYIFQFKDFSQDLMNTWGTSCGTKIGTFAGSGNTVRTLFERQITDYRDIVEDVNLSSVTSNR